MSRTPTRMGYNIKVTPVGELAIRDREMTFRAEVATKSGRTLERTVVAKGRAKDSLVNAIRIGERITIRGFYEKTAANDDVKGGEYIAALCLPRIDLRKRAA